MKKDVAALLGVSALAVALGISAAKTFSTAVRKQPVGTPVKGYVQVDRGRGGFAVVKPEKRTGVRKIKGKFKPVGVKVKQNPELSEKAKEIEAKIKKITPPKAP